MPATWLLALCQIGQQSDRASILLCVTGANNNKWSGQEQQKGETRRDEKQVNIPHQHGQHSEQGNLSIIYVDRQHSNRPDDTTSPTDTVTTNYRLHTVHT